MIVLEIRIDLTIYKSYMPIMLLDDVIMYNFLGEFLELFL
jgi:hypothetical protein